MTGRKIMIYSVIFLMIILIGGFFIIYKSGNSFSLTKNRGLISGDLSRRIGEIGAEKAYQEFKKKYADKAFGVQHQAAHDAGRTLYDKVGTSGFSICDSSFAFGCYHALLGRAIADRGVGIIPDLASACRLRYGSNDTGCKHGIGHGIMEFLGRKKLLQALELCKETGQTHPLFGCTSGVFMEYNNATIFRGGQAYPDIRPVNFKNLHEPCDSLISEDFRSSCYFEIGLWWKTVLGNDYSRVGNLCVEVDGSKERESCFRGWGTVVAENIDYNPSRAREVCNFIKDKFGAANCIAGAAMRFNSDGKHMDEGRELCEIIDKDVIADCGR